jgi:hypothetical protein
VKDEEDVEQGEEEYNENKQVREGEVSVRRRRRRRM